MNSFIILPQHSFKFVNIAIILFFLEGDVDDSLADVMIHFFELFGLLDEYSELIFEVNFISVLACFH